MTGALTEDPATASPTSGRLRLDVQGLRGIAVLLVVAFHADLPVPGGFAGVDVFFVISGFVITRMLYGELERTGHLRFGNFYARRVRRLLPALTVVLLAVLAASLLLQNPLGSQQDTSKTAAGAATFLANAVLFFNSGGYFDAAVETNPLLHTWTLAVEEQFYLVFPLVLFGAWKVAARRRLTSHRVVVSGVVAALLVLSFAASMYLTYRSGAPFHDLARNRRFAFYGSPSRAWEFGFGVLVAVAEPYLRARLTRPQATILSIAGVVLLGLSAFLLSESDPWPGILAVAPVLGTALLIMAGTSIFRTPTTRILNATWLVWVGDLSYSWYLWHWPAIVFTRLLYPSASVWLLTFAAAAALVPSWLSYRFVEEPFRRNRRIVGVRAVALGVACVVLSGAAAFGLRAFANHPGDDMAQLVADYQPHLDANGCAGNLPNAAGKSPECTWGADGSNGTVLLLGDSNAGQFAEPVRQVANELGYDFELATYGGCLVANVRMAYDYPYPAEACSQFAGLWSNSVLETHPQLVVLSMAAAQYLTSGEVRLEAPDGTIASTPSERAALYEAALETELRKWAAAGVPTLVVHQVPHLDPDYDLRSCPTVAIWRDSLSCGDSIPLADSRSLVASATAAEETAAGAVPGTSTLDLFEKVCSPGACSPSGPSGYVYRDDAHLTVPFAETLVPEFETAMASVLGERP